jgi:hypothetical protein
LKRLSTCKSPILVWQPSLVWRRLAVSGTGWQL